MSGTDGERQVGGGDGERQVGGADPGQVDPTTSDVGQEAPDLVLDARALHCPLPIVKLAKAARALDPGSLVEVWWTDPAAEHDIPAWARMRGHAAVGGGPHPTDPAARVTTIRIGG